MKKNKIQIIVLAAGHGKRMKNKELPKVLVPLGGKPIISYVLAAIKKSNVSQKPIIVIGQKANQVKRVLGPNFTYVLQTKQLGTGHAVACTKKILKDRAENILVLYGDMPLVTPHMIRKLIQTHLKEDKVLTMATVIVPDFDDWRQTFADFGRIKRDKNDKIIQIIEKKDATLEQLKIKEVNPSYFCFKAWWLWQNINKLKNNNAQKEYYLTDLAGITFEQGEEIATVAIDPKEALGINTAEQLQLISHLT